MVRSAGPDKQFDTGDDLTAYLEVRGRKPVGRPSSGASRIDLNIEHDRGPYNGLAEIAGLGVGPAGRRSGGRRCDGPKRIQRGHPIGSGESAMANSAWRAFRPGEYDVKVSSGPETVSRRVAIQVRDRGVLSVMLRQEGWWERGVVASEPPRRFRMGKARLP
jgi:hypothetical protein